MQPRAQVGEPRTALAYEQGCSCFADPYECLVHSCVVAYVVGFKYLGRKRLLTGPNSYIHIPIKHEVKFYSSFEEAIGEWTTSHHLLETAIYKKVKEGVFEPLNTDEYEIRDEIAEKIRDEVEGPKKMQCI